MYLKTKSGRKVSLPSDEEDAAIVQQAKEDGTYHTEEELKNFKPASEIPELQGLLKANRGRPKSDNPKISATLRYDSNVLEYFKSTGKGWQTRMNDVLAKYVASH